jgi:hypothetical protein
MYALNHTKNSSLICPYHSYTIEITLCLRYPLYVRLKTQDKKSQGVKDFLAMGKYMLCKGMLETREIYCVFHSVCENKFLHSKTQAGCGSKRLTNMYTLTLHKYQTNKYLQRKRKLFIRTANNVVLLLLSYCQK